MKYDICFYHDDMDGIASASVVKPFVHLCQFFPVSHINPCVEKELENKSLHVLFLDYVPEKNILEKLLQTQQSITIIDHHKTSEYTKNINSEKLRVHHDMSMACCTLTWKVFHNSEAPRYLKLIGDRDIWKNEFPESHFFHEYLMSLIIDLDDFIEVFHDNANLDQKIELGRRLSRKKETDIPEIVKKNAKPFIFEGHDCLAVNFTNWQSDIGHHIYEDLGYTVAMVFHRTKSGWRFSIYSHKVDVSKLATKYGGGGHPNASGFFQKELFKDLL